MSVCNPCIKTKTLPNCLGELVVGTIGLVSQSVKVYIQDLATGALTILQGTADSDGLVTLTLPESPAFFDTHPYELWITEAGAGIGDFQTITIEDSTSDIVCLRFTTIRGDDGSVETYLTQTLAAA